MDLHKCFLVRFQPKESQLRTGNLIRCLFFLGNNRNCTVEEKREMTLIELNNLRYIEKEIILLQLRIRELENETERITPILTNLPGSGDKKSSIVEQLVEEKEKLGAALQTRQEERRKAMRFINGIPDCQLRIIFILRFISGKSWNEVADYIGGGNTEQGVCMRAIRYLRKFESC